MISKRQARELQREWMTRYGKGGSVNILPGRLLFTDAGFVRADFEIHPGEIQHDCPTVQRLSDAWRTLDKTENIKFGGENG